METGDWGKKDRLSHRTSIGVVGNGFVGGAVVNGFGDYCIVNVFDSDPDRCYNTYIMGYQNHSHSTFFTKGFYKF